jgi:hypothetical protein
MMLTCYCCCDQRQKQCGARRCPHACSVLYAPEVNQPAAQAANPGRKGQQASVALQSGLHLRTGSAWLGDEMALVRGVPVGDSRVIHLLPGHSTIQP